uniref:Protein kinase domain-containing protein n=1 Tax=Brassica oleracea var. oleracea TaxID=109376 RepID=A0A0D3C5W8_BRAOL
MATLIWGGGINSKQWYHTTIWRWTSFLTIDANRFKIQEVIGKGNYGVVGSAIDTLTCEKVAIKKIHDIFEHLSDAARILHAEPVLDI